MRRLKEWFGYLKEAGTGMINDQVPMMGAALAYYTIFSIAPLLIIAIGLAGVVFGEGANFRIFDTISAFIGKNGAEAIRSMVEAASKRPNVGVISTVIGIVTLIVGASGVFQQLQQSLNIIWKVAAKPTAGWGKMVRQRLLSFAMVAALGFILLVSLLISAALSAVGEWASGLLPGGQSLWALVNSAVSVVVSALLFSAVLKYLPDVLLEWRDVWVGGVLTAALFEAGKMAIGAYLGRTSIASSYGAAGSLIIVLLWVYYSSQIFFFGAEFTRVWATREGRPIEPLEDSMFALSPIQASLIAQTLADGNGDGAEHARPIPRADVYAAEGTAAIAFLLLARGLKRPGRALAGGVAAGVSLGIVFALRVAGLLGGKRAEPEEPSVTSKVISKIPTRVKVATVVGGIGGAVKGGGREAGRELKAKGKELVGMNP